MRLVIAEDQALLREGFGFASLAQVASIEIAERAYPIGFCALGRRVPVVIAPAGSGFRGTPSRAIRLGWVAPTTQ